MIKKTQFKIKFDELHSKVHKIYDQYDEGEISIKMANHRMKVACKKFLK